MPFTIRRVFLQYSLFSGKSCTAALVFLLLPTITFPSKSHHVLALCHFLVLDRVHYFGHGGGAQVYLQVFFTFWAWSVVQMLEVLLPSLQFITFQVIMFPA